jgi:membrane carboxypeptidase/penicillin-binding protein PbpC
LDCGLRIADCGLKSEIPNPTSAIGAPCTVHLTAKVDPATGVRLCPRCIEGHMAEDRIFEAWPVELAAWLGQHGRGEHLLPPHNSQCSGTDAKGSPPRILSPAADQTLVLLPAQEADFGSGISDFGFQSAIRNPQSAIRNQRLALKASGHTAILYWFVDGSLFATGEPQASAFWPLSRGRHVITCCDDAGRSASVSIAVQ